jgi:hypothetical protein
MKYALLAYSEPASAGERQAGKIDPALAEVLARPNVVGWVRLHNVESATSVRGETTRALLTDGPFVDSKEYLGGLIIVEAENLDGALAIASELRGHMRNGGGIEVRPILEQELGGA